jgi:hypothetical protein
VNKKHILLAVLGLATLLLLAAGIVAFSAQDAQGKLTFTGFQGIDGVPRAFFAYNPPRGLKQASFIKCQCVEVDGDSALGQSSVGYGIPYETPAPRHFAVVCPEGTSVWRLRLVVVVGTKGIQGVIGRMRNVLIQKSLTAWNYQPVYSVAPIYSLPITNPPPGTLLPETEQ